MEMKLRCLITAQPLLQNTVHRCSQASVSLGYLVPGEVPPADPCLSVVDEKQQKGWVYNFVGRVLSMCRP